MAQAKPAIELDHVSFSWGRQAGDRALDDVSLRVEQNDFLGLIGPNGGGKTTLLKVMLGLLSPQAGRVRIFGQPPRQASRRIGYVAQHTAIDPQAPATVMDVVLMGRLSRSTWASWGMRYSKADHAAAEEALARVGCASFARRPIQALSGGQRQRVLIARALAGEAELLLLDEPTTGVDMFAEQGLIGLLTELNTRLPIVIVSHDIAFVSRRLTRVACLNRRMTVHGIDELTDDAIHAMYHSPVARVHHDEGACPIHGGSHGGDDHLHDGADVGADAGAKTNPNMKADTSDD